MHVTRLTLLLALSFAACHTPPPTPWLRYELAGPAGWADLGRGEFGGAVFGADVRISIHDPDARVKLVVENPTSEPVSLQVGPDAGDPDVAIGEVLLRELAANTVGGPPMQIYLSQQPLVVEPGWRATFFLDEPLGRPVKLGQYFVLSLLAEDGAGERERRLLPLVGRREGTVPARAR